jgi:carboxypeptidase PM20D1
MRRGWFRTLLARLGLVLLVLAAVLIARTLMLTSVQSKVEPVKDRPLDAGAAAERLAGALRFRTVSNQDHGALDASQFLGLHQYLQQAFPRVHAALGREVVGGYSLLYTWAGSDPALAPILLMGHMDVVPVEPGTEAQWTHPPFEGRIADGYVWGRGAWDDKAGVLGTLEAVENLLEDGHAPRRTILLAFGHDEEAGGHGGAAQIAALLGQRGVKPEMVLDEGLIVGVGLVPGLSAPVAAIGTAEKGYVTLELTATAQGGHSSVPPRTTAIGVLAEAIRRLEQNPVPGGLTGLVRQTFERLAPEMPFTHRLVFANLWLFRPLVERSMEGKPSSAALLRTTTAVTIVEGGVKENVLPSSARAIVNFRILPGDSMHSVTEHVRETVRGLSVEVRQAGDPGQEPSPVSDAGSEAFRRVERTVREVLPEAIVAPALVTGATDARHYAPLSRNVYRFRAILVGPEDVQRFHGKDERIAVENHALAIRFLRRLILNSSE